MTDMDFVAICWGDFGLGFLAALMLIVGIVVLYIMKNNPFSE